MGNDDYPLLYTAKEKFTWAKVKWNKICTESLTAKTLKTSQSTEHTNFLSENLVIDQLVFPGQFILVFIEFFSLINLLL